MKPIVPRIFLLFVVALILSIIPLPEIISGFRLPWVCLLFLYIQFFLPRYFNVILLFIMGCCLDVLLTTVIGEHAFALLLVSWVANAKARRIQFFSISQQMIIVGFFCFIYQGAILFIDIFLGFHFVLWTPLASGMVAIILWPWIRILLDGLLISRLSMR